MISQARLFENICMEASGVRNLHVGLLFFGFNE